jgi:hypothetical protein
VAFGAARRSPVGVCVALAGMPFAYRDILASPRATSDSDRDPDLACCSADRSDPTARLAVRARHGALIPLGPADPLVLLAAVLAGQRASILAFKSSGPQVDRDLGFRPIDNSRHPVELSSPHEPNGLQSRRVGRANSGTLS